MSSTLIQEFALRVLPILNVDETLLNDVDGSAMEFSILANEFSYSGQLVLYSGQ